MLTPPWQNVDADEDKLLHTLAWILGWMWALAGIILGALISPYLLTTWGLMNSTYHDLVVICVAAVMGFLVQFLVQFLGWALLFSAFLADELFTRDTNRESLLAVFIIVFICLPLPLALVDYGIYLYVSTIGAQSGLISTGVIGGVWSS
jgi:hypothetical protein